MQSSNLFAAGQEADFSRRMCGPIVVPFILAQASMATMKLTKQDGSAACFMEFEL